MRYILDTPLITNWGTWVYKPLTVKQAKKWLEDKYGLPVVSGIRRWEIVCLIEELTGVYVPIWGHVPTRGQIIKMKPGDEALVFRWRVEKNPGGALEESKGRLTPGFVKKYIEIGLLKCIRK
jgi:hypothetical protein